MWVFYLLNFYTEYHFLEEMGYYLRTQHRSAMKKEQTIPFSLRDTYFKVLYMSYYSYVYTCFT